MGKPAPPLIIATWLSAKSQPEFGRATIIDFWSTTCGPCIASFPKLIALHGRFRDDGLVVITIHREKAIAREEGLAAGFLAFEERRAERVLPDFLARRGIPFPVGVDREGTTFRAFAVTAIPTYFILDKRGVVRYESHRLPDEKDVLNTLSR